MQLTQLSAIESIIVAGGKASRLDGVDKVMLPLGDRGLTLLEKVIESCPGKVFVVGPKRNITAQVNWVSDLVDAGGPAAGIWAGLAEIKSDYVFISAADQKLTREISNQICHAAVGKDGAWALRANGQGQPLLACIKTDLIRKLLEPSKGIDASPIRLMQNLELVGVKVNEDQIQDIDTWNDVLKAARELNLTDVTQIWLKQVAAVLGIPEEEIPIDELLDTTREVAHNVERKSAPLTTYLIGLAAAKTGKSPKELIENVNNAVNAWSTNE